MNLDPALFSQFPIGLTVILYGCCLLLALWFAPWKTLIEARVTHVFFGAAVALMFLWNASTPVQPGLSFHLLGLTAVTLILGWSFAVLAAAFALIGGYLNVGIGWVKNT